MFGLFYSIFVFICKILLSIKENVFINKEKFISMKENKILYHDIYGDLYLTSNNHKVNPFGVDLKTGDVGIKDIKTGKLIYNVSENERINDEKYKEILVKEIYEYNKNAKKESVKNNVYYYNGKDIDYYQCNSNHKHWYKKDVFKRTFDDLNIIIEYKTIFDERKIFKLHILDTNENNIEKIKEYNSSIILDKKGALKSLGYSKEDLVNYANKIGAIY